MRTARIISLIVLFLFLICSPCHAISIGFNQTTFTADIGGSFTADLLISDLGNGSAPSLGTFDININFDPAILNLTGVTFGDQLDILGLGSIQDSIPSFGSVNLFELSLDLADDLDFFQEDSFALASITFEGIFEGSSSLDFVINTLGDSFGDTLFIDSINGAKASVGAAAPVPEPSTILLFSAGLLGLVYFRKINIQKG